MNEKQKNYFSSFLGSIDQSGSINTLLAYWTDILDLHAQTYIIRFSFENIENAVPATKYDVMLYIHINYTSFIAYTPHGTDI